jgi:hypothetical protein
MRILVIFLGLTALGSGALSAQVVAFKTGEQTTGTTKQCYYEFAGSRYTRTVESYQLCPLSIQVRSATPTPSPSPTPSRGVVAFKTGEQTTGTTKQCYYEFAGSRYTRTVESYQLCPLSIQVRR